MEYQSSTTLGSESSSWDPYTGESTEPAGSNSLPKWRSGFENRPWLCLGIAFAAGAAAGALIPASDSEYEDYYAGSSSYSGTGTQSSTYGRSKTSSYLSQTWSKMQSAFIVAATRQAENFLEELVPGFREAYREQGQDNGNPSTSEMP